MSRTRNLYNCQRYSIFPSFHLLIWVSLINFHATWAVENEKFNSTITRQQNLKDDISALDDRLPDVILTESQRLDRFCKSREQPFSKELDCTGLGIKFLQQVKLNQDATPIIETLILAKNRLQKLNSDAFESKTIKNLQRLDISSNRLAAIETDALKSFESLIVLNLANNHLQTLPLHLFNQLSRLLDLNLADNQLWMSPGLTFPILPSVRRLDLSGNTQLLSQAPDEFLSAVRLPALKQLRLANCGLRNLSDRLFGNELNSLSRLDLSGNRFDRVPNRALRTLPHLHTLLFNDNPMVYNLNRDQLAGMRQLRSLQVSRLARLRSVGAFTFQDQPLLRELICSQNPRLIRIETNAFHLDEQKINSTNESSSNQTSSNSQWYPTSAAFVSKDKLLRSAMLPPLQVLHLQQNALTTVHPLMINYRQLRSFDLSANPLRCDCQLNFLFGLTQKGVVVRNRPHTTCARPRRWAKMSVYQAAAVAMGGEVTSADTSGMFGNEKKLEFECQRIFDEDNDVFWGMFLLLSCCFICVLFIFCALSLHVRTRFVNLIHSCCGFVGFRRSWMNCYDCCGLLNTKGKYSSFEPREQRRQGQQEPVDRIRADLEWDDNELDL